MSILFHIQRSLVGFISCPNFILLIVANPDCSTAFMDNDDYTNKVACCYSARVDEFCKSKLISCKGDEEREFKNDALGFALL